MCTEIIVNFIVIAVFIDFFIAWDNFGAIDYFLWSIPFDLGRLFGRGSTGGRREHHAGRWEKALSTFVHRRRASQLQSKVSATCEIWMNVDYEWNELNIVVMKDWISAALLLRQPKILWFQTFAWPKDGSADRPTDWLTDRPTYTLKDVLKNESSIGH